MRKSHNCFELCIRTNLLGAAVPTSWTAIAPETKLKCGVWDYHPRYLKLSSEVFEIIIRCVWNYHQMCLKLSSDVFETIIRGCLLSLHHHLQHVLLSLSENKSFLSHSILIDSCVTAGGLTLTLTLALTLLGGFYPNAFWCIFFHCTTPKSWCKMSRHAGYSQSNVHGFQSSHNSNDFLYSNSLIILD